MVGWLNRSGPRIQESCPKMFLDSYHIRTAFGIFKEPSHDAGTFISHWVFFNRLKDHTHTCHLQTSVERFFQELNGTMQLSFQEYHNETLHCSSSNVQTLDSDLKCSCQIISIKVLTFPCKKNIPFKNILTSPGTALLFESGVT